MTMLLSGRQVATRAGQASLLAVVMMTAALLPTFVSQGCSGCSAFDASGLPASTLRTSPDAWAAVWIPIGWGVWVTLQKAVVLFR